MCLFPHHTRISIHLEVHQEKSTASQTALLSHSSSKSFYIRTKVKVIPFPTKRTRFGSSRGLYNRVALRYFFVLAWDPLFNSHPAPLSSYTKKKPIRGCGNEP